MPRDVPLRRSLLLRLLAVSALVSVCSVAATAWLTVRGTTVAIEQEQGQALADDAKVYDALLGYAAGHTTWAGARDAVRRLARDVGHRITLTTEDRTPILDSDQAAGGPPPGLPARPTAVIAPLAVDTALAMSTPSDRIDPRAVGPFRLPQREREQLRAAARQRVGACATASASPPGSSRGRAGGPGWRRPTSTRPWRTGAATRSSTSRPPPRPGRCANSTTS